MRLISHPKILWVLAFGKLWDTFSYFGTQTILALYFIHIFHLDRSTSYLLYGAYAALAFSAPILGGIISDRWIGVKHAVIAGCILNIMGNLIMVSLDRYLFCLGLATSVIGSGLYKSNSMSLVGVLYKDGDARKESGFTWFYLAMNAGGTLGPLVYGVVAYSFGWNYAFLCSALGVLIGALWFLKNWHILNTDGKTRNLSASSLFLIYTILLGVCFFLSLAFYFPDFLNLIICISFAISIFYLLVVIRRYEGRERRRLFAAFLLCLVGMFYFAAGLQTGTTITLFIQHEIQQGTVNTHLPGSTFNMLYCLFVVLLAPCFAHLWAKLKSRGLSFSAPTKLALGIGLATIGIATFAFASITSFILTSVLIGYIFLSAGELVITPAAYTAISDLSPPGMKSTMMGCWLLFVAIGGYFSSILANTSHFIVKQLPFQSNDFLGIFLCIAIFTLAVAIVAAALVPKLLKMMV